MKKIVIYTSIILLVTIIAVVIILSFGFIWKYIPLNHSPHNDICRVDADCVCRQPCCDRCGEMGDAWFCVEKRCKLVPRNDLIVK